jgi:hypothetical protein
MAYRIISERIGVVGAIYEPAEGINIDALIAGGFIEVVPTSPTKSAKKKGTAPDAGNDPKE